MSNFYSQPSICKSHVSSVTFGINVTFTYILLNTNGEKKNPMFNFEDSSIILFDLSDDL